MQKTNANERGVLRRCQNDLRSLREDTKDSTTAGRYVGTVETAELAAEIVTAVNSMRSQDEANHCELRQRIASGILETAYARRIALSAADAEAIIDAATSQIAETLSRAQSANQELREVLRLTTDRYLEAARTIISLQETLLRARYLTQHWRSHWAARSTETVATKSCAHPLAMIQAALDGTTDPAELGLDQRSGRQLESMLHEARLDP